MIFRNNNCLERRPFGITFKLKIFGIITLRDKKKKKKKKKEEEEKFGIMTICGKTVRYYELPIDLRVRQMAVRNRNFSK